MLFAGSARRGESGKGKRHLRGRLVALLSSLSRKKLERH